MASRSVSPGGALLRASRVFSIPPPLPRPAVELSSKGVNNSDTATLAHPIHQTITTPHLSLAQGDWGFKRPLPLRSTTKSSTPFLRVEAIDTFEHITEFASAADHSITLQKWQEMGIPLTIRMGKNQGSFRGEDEGRISVFESTMDSIAESDGSVLGREDTRWKFKGPWLAGQTEGDFNEFLREGVKKRKTEFQAYLKTACANAHTKEARRAAAEGAVDVPAAVKEEDITKEQLTEFVRSLRNNRAELYKLIRNFLDLPPAPARYREVTERMIDMMRPGETLAPNDLPLSASPYANTGPPKTHPSAGLAYGLTSCHTHNHPLHGPQKENRPVQARVVKPKNSATGGFGAALGVGGFVTEVPRDSASFNVNERNPKRGMPKVHPGLQNIEPEKVGGTKIWIRPSYAHVDPKGRIILTVADADPMAVAVAEGTEGAMSAVFEIPKLSGTLSAEARKGFGTFSTAPQGDGGYGLTLDVDDAPRREPVRPRDSPRSQVEGLSDLS
ncbi:mitochondrial 37S ribosomal protein bS1m [Drepanopeziza brunnea f. sp. 'multigermtubi']|uniref:Uncharacterized protein n=1 Tax=Marssonina brunnea f. sp. multigermtubi (strain MB_m1) TaxID=1072389 RepID=K1XH37_MARBU|nr:uncharacterized protein MBM_02035 [Drepanopeziza brunnea f. sp. 'multigermtubi' MB_m1]EKD20083.1 hypothetical protein MBM_02035 [Drepanopeziza brunnea f. sp. 'multigermtubi' MB_m1]KAJ5050358.1 hypothetical protein L3040_002241 [Drepanopeziza brunnea f. sp. 'multigermtubi']